MNGYIVVSEKLSKAVAEAVMTNKENIPYIGAYDEFMEIYNVNKVPYIDVGFARGAMTVYVNQNEIQMILPLGIASAIITANSSDKDNINLIVS